MRGGEREGREKRSAVKVDVGVDSTKSVIKVESRCGHERCAKNFSESTGQITVVGIIVIVIVGHHNACACADICMPSCNVDIRAYVVLE